MMADKGCAERGCPMHEVGDEFVEMVPKREWVGLTDEEIKMANDFVGFDDEWVEVVYHFACVIEAKLKEKNT